MRNSWTKLVDAVLSPERANLDVCLQARAEHIDARRSVAEGRARAILRCTAEIEDARRDVFAANDGVVTAKMTELEHKWRRLSRVDVDGGLQDLWARIAPPSWLDRKRWRDSAPCARLDAAIALASDVQGVESAEAAVRELGTALRALGTTIPGRVAWQPWSDESDYIVPLLEKPLQAAVDRLSRFPERDRILERARKDERDVHQAAANRFSDPFKLGQGLGHAAFIDFLWHAAELQPTRNPMLPLYDLWRSGYAIVAVEQTRVVLGFPPVVP